MPSIMDASAGPSSMASDARVPTKDSIDAGNGAGTVVAEPQDEATHVFDQSTLRSYNVVIDPADLAMINEDPTEETYVNGMLEVDGTSYGPLAVRYKGSVGGFRAPCTGASPDGQTMDPEAPQTPSFGRGGGPKTGKCSIKVDFDRIDPQARFFGLKKLNFHAMGRDQSMMRDRLGYQLFREFGVAAPRAMHARLSINGQPEGLYVVVEQIDGRFTKSRFTEGGDGNLYKEVWPTDWLFPDRYLSALETNEDDNPSVAKMLELALAVAVGPEQSFRWFDVRYLYRYIAVDRLIINDDGAFHWYCTSNHNFYWYEAERANRFWLIPWDLDSSFQGGAAFVHIDTPWNQPPAFCSCAGGQLQASCDPLTAQWASRDEDYQRAVDEFIAGPFAEESIAVKLESWTAQIDAAAREMSGLHGAPTYEGWQVALARLRDVIATSREHRGYPYGLDMETDGGSSP